MGRCMLCCWIAWLGLVTGARAGGDNWIILGGGNSYWGDNGSLPISKKIWELQKAGHTFKSVVFTPDGDWVILMEGNAFWTSNGELPACKKLDELQKQGSAIEHVAFAPNGGWAVFFDQTASLWDGIEGDEPRWKVIQQVAKAGGALRSIAFAPGGGWVMLYNKTGVMYRNVPKDLAEVLSNAQKNRLCVRCVSFTASGDWLCLADKGWWTSDRTLAVSKSLDPVYKSGSSATWVALTPEDPATLRYRLETKPSHRVKAVLTTDLALPKAKMEEWYVYNPVVPNLPSQQAVKTTVEPEGKVVHESSPLKRPLILTRITDGRTAFHGLLTVEATLMSRRLRPLRAGENGPKVADLSPEEVKNYTRATPSFILDSKPFRDWMDAAGLKRRPGESDMAYARRAFSYVKHHFTYVYPNLPGVDTIAKICVAGKSDCGGLSGVFVQLMRVNGIPARDLGGCWDNGQCHMKAEFFAHGIGWIPVDASGAVGDTGGSEFACFGNDSGDFITLVDDTDLVIDTFQFGTQNIPCIQATLVYSRHSGDDTGSSYKAEWTMHKEKMSVK